MLSVTDIFLLSILLAGASVAAEIGKPSVTVTLFGAFVFDLFLLMGHVH
jgi:hypothetical protein